MTSLVLPVRRRYCALRWLRDVAATGSVIITGVLMFGITAERADAGQTPPVLAQSYLVSLNIAPDTNSWMDAAELPECDGTDEGGLLCTIMGAWSDTKAGFTGYVVDPATSQRAAFKATCAFDASTNIDFTISLPEQDGWLPQVDLVNSGGTIAVDCSWNLRAPDKQHSVLSGRFHGSGPLESVDPANAVVRLSNNFIVEVLGGSGVYADEVGSGTFAGEVKFSLLGDTGELPIDFEVVSLGEPEPGTVSGSRRPSATAQSAGASAVAVSSASAPASAAADDSMGSFDLALHSGKGGVRIVTPARVKRSQAKFALHAVTSPRASCKIAASRSGRTVGLGTRRAGNDGLVAFPKDTGKKLDKGVWRVSTACVTDDGTVRDTRKVTITR